MRRKMFLTEQVEILDKLEQLLKKAYPIEEINLTNANNSKENVQVSNVPSKPLDVPVLPFFDTPASTIQTSVEKRNQNIVSFLGDILASAKSPDNFSKSPVKVPNRFSYT